MDNFPGEVRLWSWHMRGKQVGCAGQTIASTGSSSNPYMFKGAWGYRSDGDSGLSHVGARYYDAQVGRFFTRDTYLDQHPHLYCEHSPVNAVDPSGHQSQSPWPARGVPFRDLINGAIKDATPESGLGRAAGRIGVAHTARENINALGDPGANGAKTFIVGSISVISGLGMVHSAIAVLAPGTATLAGAGGIAAVAAGTIAVVGTFGIVLGGAAVIVGIGRIAGAW